MKTLFRYAFAAIMAAALALAVPAYGDSASATGWIWVGGSDHQGASGVYGTLGVTAKSNVPGARSAPASWTDASGNLWMFGGYGAGAAGIQGQLNDLWKFDGTAWTWMGGSTAPGARGVYGTQGIAAPGNTPGGRTNAVTWVDENGDVWLFGGYGVDSNGAFGDLGDLWKFDGTNWTWVSGSSLAGSGSVYGTLGVTDSGNVLGSRQAPVIWGDSAGNLWVFGGFGVDSAGVRSQLNDLWKFDGSNWTWMGGSNRANALGVYGTKGTTAAGNYPGARTGAVRWVDESGNLLMFGGWGAAASAYGSLNDLWKFDGTNWTWVGGSNTAEAVGTYGTQGVATAGNAPGGRSGAAGWLDSDGNIWVFGGLGRDVTGTTGSLNDLWEFDGTNWIWMGGGNTVNAAGVYGSQGTFSVHNVPGGRYGGATWVDGLGNFWLFSGMGYDVIDARGPLNDFWRYHVKGSR